MQVLESIKPGFECLDSSFTWVTLVQLLNFSVLHIPYMKME